jgi:hypothetical protein
MPFLAVLTNDQGEVLGTAATEIRGRGTGLPGQASLVARPGQQIIQIEVGDEVMNLDPSALHEFIKVNYLHPSTKLVDSSAAPGPTNAGGAPNEPRNERKSQSKDHDLVITPAGPMPKESVHPVRPNEAVRRNPDGAYSVVPNESISKDFGQIKQDRENSSSTIKRKSRRRSKRK